MMSIGKLFDVGPDRASWRWFSILIPTSQVVGILAVILLAILFGQYRGGFGWTVS